MNRFIAAAAWVGFITSVTLAIIHKDMILVGIAIAWAILGAGDMIADAIDKTRNPK